MSNAFSRGWKRLMGGIDRAVEDSTSTEVKVHRAISDARERHATLQAHAASLIGNRRVAETELARAEGLREKLGVRVEEALRLSEAAAAGGDPEAATRAEAAAQELATELARTDARIEEYRGVIAEAEAAERDAREMLDEDAKRLKKAISEKDVVLLESIRADIAEADAETDAGGSTPGFGAVRAKIERRIGEIEARAGFAGAGGVGAGGASAGGALSVDIDAREAAGRARLEELRSQMHAEQHAISGADPGTGTGAGTGTDTGTDTGADTGAGTGADTGAGAGTSAGAGADTDASAG